MFLSKTELDYLTANQQFSKDYRYTIKSRLQKKVQQFAREELPLLIEQGYLDLTEFRKVELTENCKESNIGTGQADGELALEGNFSSCTVRSSIADLRVAPDEIEQRPKEVQEYIKKCSGRDLNPGSATRKAAMLDRTVQPYLGETATTPPEHSQTV